MEEKERYEMNGKDCLVDNEQNTTICDFCELTLFPEIIINLLNEQSKRIKELELLLKADKKIETNSLNGFEKLRKENQQLKEQLEIFKKVNDALQQDNLDLSYDKVDMAYEYAKEMAENWDNDYQEEIRQLKQSQKQLAIEELKMFGAMLSRAVLWDNDYECWTISEEVYNSFMEQIDDKIKKLKGEE